ncbi:hypothetical protein BDV93DRAFT_518990, partial [Ceratobasidium sp. AG-I]
MGSSVMPVLQHLDLVFYWPYDIEDEDGYAYECSTSLGPSLLLQSSPPKLDTINLQRVPNAFLFGHPTQPQFSNLTYLKLGLILQYPNLHDLNLLLASNPQLVVLRIGMSSAGNHFRPSNYDLPQVRLLRLKELALTGISASLWALGFVKMLDVPNTNYLKLTVGNGDGQYGQFAQYIIKGSNETTPALLFPSLTRLVFDLPSGGCSATLRLLLTPYTKITFLDILRDTLKVLLDQPWLVPDLSHLRATGATGELLKEIVDARLSARLPLRVLEANWRSRDLVKRHELKYLKDNIDFAFVDFSGRRSDLYNGFEGGTGTIEI